MASFNKVILVGNLTRDPEVRYIPSGAAVCDIGLAVNSQWTDRKTNERKEEVTFIDVTLWGRTAEIAGEYLAKGRPVLIEGRLHHPCVPIGLPNQIPDGIVQKVAGLVQLIGFHRDLAQTIISPGRGVVDGVLQSQQVPGNVVGEDRVGAVRIRDLGNATESIVSVRRHRRGQTALAIRIGSGYRCHSAQTIESRGRVVAHRVRDRGQKTLWAAGVGLDRRRLSACCRTPIAP